jgi:hypothetical protein
MRQQQTRSPLLAAQPDATRTAGSSPAAASDGPGAYNTAFLWLGVVLLALPFLFWVLRRGITLDFWYDEVYTLDHFIFVPLYKTVSDYSQPNNHILFNLLSNVYVSILGLRDTYAAMDSPWVLRLLPLFWAAGTLGFAFQAARRCGGAAAGYLAVIVLATTVPFFNFSAQVRGYSLSMLLLTAMVYFLFRWEQDGRTAHAAAASAAGALALYTIPSNLYFLLSVGAFYVAAAVVRAAGGARRRVPGERGTTSHVAEDARPAGFVRRLANRYLVAAVLMAWSLAGAVVLYLPVLRQVLSTDALRAGGGFDAATLARVMPRMFQYLASGRFVLLLLPVAAGFAGIFGRRVGDGVLCWRWLFCLTVLVLPFLWSSIRGDRPPDRVFVNLAPVFALFVAISARITFGVLQARRNLALGAIAAAALYCYAAFGLALRDIDRHLLADVEQGRRSQDAFYAYYQAYYGPSRVMKDLLARHAVQPAPIYMCEYGDQVAMFRYMQKTRLPYLPAYDPAQIEVGPDGLAYVVTAWPQKYQRQIAEARSSLACEIVTPRPAFCGLLVCRRR